MQQRSFDWLAKEVGWQGQIREVMELREVQALSVPEIAQRMNLSEPEVEAQIQVAMLLADRWRASRMSLAEQLEHARELLFLARGRRRIHVGRTHGPARTGRDGMGDLGREIVPAMVERSAFPNEWDLVAEPQDSPDALPPAERHRRRRETEAATRESERLRRMNIQPQQLNRRQRRMLRFQQRGSTC